MFASKGAKIIMTTALSDMKNISEAFSNLCDGYLTKPIDKKRLIEEMQNSGVIE